MPLSWQRFFPFLDFYCFFCKFKITWYVQTENTIVSHLLIGFCWNWAFIEPSSICLKSASRQTSTNTQFVIINWDGNSPQNVAPLTVSFHSHYHTFSLVCWQPLPCRSATSPRQRIPDDHLSWWQRLSDWADVTCGAVAPFPSLEVQVFRVILIKKKQLQRLLLLTLFCGGICSVTSIHPCVLPSSNIFTPLRIVPPESVPVEPPQHAYGWNSFSLTIFHLLPLCPTIATVTEAYLRLSAPRSDTSSQLRCFWSNEVTAAAAAAAKWFVAWTLLWAAAP